MPNRFAGYVEAVEPSLVGWVIDSQHPNEPVSFSVTVDRGLPVPIVADLPRPDVVAAGHGGPNCGFALALPPHLFDGAPHQIEFALGDGAPLTLRAWRSPIVLGSLSPEIVPLTQTDLAAVADLLRQTHEESGLDATVISDRYVEGWIAAAIGASGGLLLGARVGQLLAGYALVERGGDGRRPIGIVGLSVLRHYRRKGLGERLMRSLLGAVRDGTEMGEVWLSVAADNLPARRLYEKLGFVYRAQPPPGLTAPATYLAMSWRGGR
jgi:ribosomal protein S18 acetylase RimI-like enzyme